MKFAESHLPSLATSAALALLVALAFPLSSAQGAPPTSASKASAAKTVAPAPSEDAQIIQVLNRLGFGPRPGDVEAVRATGISRWIDNQLNPNSIDDSAVENKLTELPSLRLAPAQLANAYRSDQARQRLNRQAKAVKANARATNNMGDEKMLDETAAKPVASQLALAKPNRVVQERDEEILAEAERNGFGANVTNQIVGEMQTAKLVRSVESKRQLQEVLVDFWTNHFNVDVKKGQVATLRLADERDAIRPNVLGKFRDLLGASAKSPAMLIYLDNARSTREMPGVNNANRRRRANAPAARKKARGGINENYARELMELHTLGVNGGYTQKDVQEVARCFTGWSVNPQTGEFIFRPFAHDNESKVVLGQTIPAGGGINDGEKVLDILAAHPATARHLAFKLCQRFVADAPPPALVERVAQAYLKAGGDLKATTRAIVTAPEFLAGPYIGVKIKSPYEFVVSAVRAMDGSVVIPNTMQARGRIMLIANGASSAKRNYKGQAAARTLPREISAMGQPMFACVPPTGYPEDSSNWVSAGALVSRLNFALNLSNGGFQDVRTAPPPRTGTQSAEQRVTSLSLQLTGKELSPATRATILKQVKDDPAIDSKKLCALILGSPEFQRR